MAISELEVVGLTIYNILYGSVIWNAEIDFFGTGGGDGETGGASVGDFAGFDVVDNDIKFDILDGDFFVEILGDTINDLDIDADDFAAFVKLKWSKESVGFDDVVGSSGILSDNKSSNGGRHDNKE